MGFLDNSTVTVDAILTRRGRQILSQGGNFAITKFALSDEEVDYTLYDVTHPNGTDSYGSVIENMNLLEAVPNRAGFNSFLVNSSLAGAKLQIDSLTYSNVIKDTPISIAPATVGGPEETYTFSISNLNIIRFDGSPAQKSKIGKECKINAQSISQIGTATVRIVGNQTGLANVISIQVAADAGSTTSPDAPEDTTGSDDSSGGSLGPTGGSSSGGSSSGGSSSGGGGGYSRAGS
jgi:uncharacterized membrane protein YgcG